MLRRICHFRSAQLQSQLLTKLQFQDRFNIGTRLVHDNRTCRQICHTVKIRVWDYLKHRVRRSQLASGWPGHLPDVESPQAPGPAAFGKKFKYTARSSQHLDATRLVACGNILERIA